MNRIRPIDARHGAGLVTLAAAALLLAAAAPTHAAVISYAGAVIDNAGGEVARWKTAGVAKSLDADGDNIYGTTAHLFYTIEFKGQNTLYQFNGSDSQVGPFPGYAVVDHPDLEDNPGAGTTQVRTTTNNASGAQQVDDTMFTFTALSGSPRAVRIGVAVDGLNGAQFSPSSIGLRQTVGGSASVEQAVGANNTIDMYFFDVAGVKAGDQFQVFADAGSGGYTTHQIVTWDRNTSAFALGDVIKLDFSTAGDGDGGDLFDWNQVSTGLNTGGISAGNVVRHGDGTYIDNVSISFTGLNAAAFNNDGNSNAWAGTAADPYYIGGADDIYFNNNGTPFTTTFSGLTPNELFEVRIYSLIGNNAGELEEFIVTDGAGTVSITNSRGDRWTADSLEEAMMTFLVRADANGNLAVTVNDTAAFPLNAIVIASIVPAPAALPAGLALMGLAALRRRRSTSLTASPRR